MDTLAGMRVFTTVVDSGSFAAAAEKLDLSRGMASRYVAQVEAHLGARLLNRTTRRLSLTEAGQDYYERAVQVLALVEAAESSIARGAAQPSGVLRVNTAVVFGARYLGAAVSEYLKAHPQVRIEMTLNDRVVDLVDEGFDVAVRIARRIAPGLIARPLATSHPVVCASPAYLERHGTPRSPADLARHNCLTYAYSAAPNVWRFTRAGRTEDVKVNGTLRGNNGDLASAAAVAGLGIALEPTFITHELLRAGKLVRVLRGWEVEPYTVFAVYASRELLAPKIRSFVDFLVERFRKPGWEGAGKA
jgi:DNA-binding transcriptional LysR family regulator